MEGEQWFYKKGFFNGDTSGIDRSLAKYSYCFDNNKIIAISIETYMMMHSTHT